MILHEYFLGPLVLTLRHQPSMFKNMTAALTSTIVGPIHFLLRIMVAFFKLHFVGPFLRLGWTPSFCLWIPFFFHLNHGWCNQQISTVHRHGSPGGVFHGYIQRHLGIRHSRQTCEARLHLLRSHSARRVLLSSDGLNPSICNLQSSQLWLKNNQENQETFHCPGFEHWYRKGWCCHKKTWRAACRSASSMHEDAVKILSRFRL